MKYLIVCPYCGQELLKADDGSYIEIECPNCHKDIVIEVEKNKIIITKLI